jgi:hypothetical protein
MYALADLEGLSSGSVVLTTIYAINPDIYEDGCATWQLVPRHRGIGSEAYLNGTSQEPPVLSEVEGTSEDARLPARRAYSSERRTPISVVAVTPRREFMKYPG